MYADILDSFWGATVFFSVCMQTFYFVFAAALLLKLDLVMLSMQNEIHGVIIKGFPILFPSSAWIRKGVLNQHIGIQPTVHVSSIVSNYLFVDFC